MDFMNLLLDYALLLIGIILVFFIVGLSVKKQEIKCFLSAEIVVSLIH